jgi:hypothetical protein
LPTAKKNTSPDWSWYPWLHMWYYCISVTFSLTIVKSSTFWRWSGLDFVVLEQMWPSPSTCSPLFEARIPLLVRKSSFPWFVRQIHIWRTTTYNYITTRTCQSFSVQHGFR